MSGARLSLVVLIALLLQVAVVEHVAIAGIRPDMPLLLLVFLALRRGPIVGTLVGFGLGLLMDLLEPQTLGMNMLAKCITGYAVGRLAGGLLVGSSALHAALVGVALLLHDAISLLAYTSLDLPRSFGMYFTRSLPTALYTALAAQLILGVAAVLAGGRLLSGDGDGHAAR